MTSPFVGREIDLAFLKGIFDKTVASSSVQLVTVVGEPGLGKSRIVAELVRLHRFAARVRDLAAGPLLALWGGDHVLGVGGDPEGPHRDPGVGPAGGGARRSWPRCCRRGSEREWFRQRLLPLLGIEASSSRRSGRSCSRRGAGSWKGSRSGIRPCWCSRICTGPTRRCWRSWSTWPTWPRASRC